MNLIPHHLDSHARHREKAPQSQERLFLEIDKADGPHKNGLAFYFLFYSQL